MPKLLNVLRNQRRRQDGRMAVSWALALLLAWLLSLVVAKPVAAQAEITPSTPCFTSTNLTNLSAGGNRGITNQPVISGNGARVSFWSVNNLGGNNVDGNIEVFVRETGNTSVVQLTNSVGSILGGFNLEPSINTAGNRIAFYSDRDLVDGQNEDGNFEIFLARRANNGTWSITQITNTRGSANLFPSINSAGDRITFVSDDSELHNIDQSRVNADRNFEIFLATIPNNGAVQFRQITNTGAGVTNDQPVINAAGNRIAFTAASGQKAQVYVWDESQNAPAQLTQTDTNDQPSISADGTSIVYIATNDADRSRVVLHTLSADGSESRAEVIVPSATNTKYRSPSISGNGERVVYVAEQGTGSAIQINVMLYDVNTGLGVPISEVGGGTGEQPAISSDGTRVTFVGVQAVGGSTDNTGSDIYLNECPQGDLVLEFVTPPLTTVLAGVDVFYEFRVTNRGPSVADDAFFRSDLGALPGLPANVSFLLPPGCSTDANDILVCPLGDIGINASRVFTFGYDIPSNAGLANIVSKIEVGANIVDSDTSNNATAQFTTRIFEESALSLQVTTDRNSILAGSAEQLTYDLTVTNAGPSQARSARITDTLPIGSSFVSVQLVQGGGAGASCSPAVGRIVACNLGNLTSGSVTIVRIKVKADAAAPATLTNVATVRSLTQETNLANNTVTTNTSVERSADLAITKSAFPTDTVIAGREITYTLTFTNNGFSDTLNAVVIDSLPQNVTYVRSVLPGGASCTPSGGGQIVTCSFPGNLLVGETRTFSIVALVQSIVPAGTITNTATVRSDRADPIPGNDTTPPVATQVALLADLVVSKTVNKATPDVLEVFTYTVKLRNNGPSQAYNVVVTDILPSELTFVSATASVGSYNDTSGLWTVGTLPVKAAGQEETLTIRAFALESAGGKTKINTATAGSTVTEPTSGLPSSASVNIVPQLADIQVSKISAPTPAAHVVAGKPLTYTVTITNAGPTLARSVLLTDVLPANVFLVSVTEPALRANCSEGATITCNVGDVASGTVLNYSIVVTRALKGLITNTVSISSPTPDIVPGNNSATHSITVDPDVPHRLVYTQQPPSFETAGVSFNPAPKVELRDRFNNLVDTGSRSNDQIRLVPYTNSTCSTALGDTSAINGNTVAASGGVATFPALFYTRAETFYLRAADIDSEAAGVLTACSTIVTINPDSTKQLVITSNPQTVIANKRSLAITVERQDQFGNQTTEDNFGVNLTKTSATGVFLNSSDQQISSITISNTLASASFFYTDTVAGVHEFTVSGGSGVISDTQPITIVAGPASALLVVVSAPPTVTAGVRSTDITIARIDDFGNENSSDPTLFVTLESDSPDSNSYEFYDDDGITVITSTSIVQGDSQTTFSYLDTLAGERQLEFSDQTVGPLALTSATMSITVVPAATHHLVFSTTERTVTAGQNSAVIQVAREDEFNNRNFNDPNLLVTLVSSSTGVPDFTPDSPVTIPQGSDHVSFTYYDELADVFDLTASSGSVISATQEITVIAAAANNLVVLTNPQTIQAGTPSGEIRIQRRDAFGNPAPNGGNLTVGLTTTSASGLFVPLASLSSIPSVTISGTGTDASFRYTDTVRGVYQLHFNGGSTFVASQTITVTPAAATKLVFTQNPSTATAGVTSGLFVVERRDQFNNTHSGPSSVTVNLDTNSPGPDPFFINGSGTPDVTSVQIPSGSPTTTFRYNDTLAGTWLLTASASGLTAATANITIQPDTAHQLAFLNAPIVATAGVTSTQLTVQQQDQYGNPVQQSSGSLTVNLTTSANSPPARFVTADGSAATTQVLITTGNITTSFRYYDQKAGKPTLTATSGLPVTQVQQQATINAAKTASVTFVTPSRTLTAGQPSQPITVERRDEFGNPNSSDPALVLTLATTSTGTTDFRNANGVGSLPGGNQLTISSAFSQTSFAYVDNLRGTPQVNVSSSLITITGDSQSHTVLGAAAVRLQISGNSTQTAGQPQQLTLFAYDTYGNLSDPYTGSRTLRFGGANSAPNSTSPTVTNNASSPTNFGVNTALTFNAGVSSAGGLMTLYRAETAVITATDVVSNIHAVGAGALTVTVSANTRSQVRAETASGGSGVVVPSQEINAGQVITLYAVARDVYNNFTDNATDANWIITPTLGVTSNDINPTSGAFTAFSPNQAGTAVIAPTVGGLSSTPSGLIRVLPGAPYTVSVELAADGSGGLVSARNITAGTSITVYAITRDIFGNYIGNVAANWAMIQATGGVTTSANLAPTTASTYTVFTGKVIGTGRIRATLTGVPNNAPSGVLTVVNGPAASYTLSLASPTNIPAGTTRKVGITAVDAYGNQALDYDDDVLLTFSGPMSSTRPVFAPTVVNKNNEAKIIGTPTLIDFNDGVAQVAGNVGNVAFYRVQSGSISVSAGTISSNAVAFSVIAAAMDKISIDATTTTLTAGVPVSLTMRAEDAYGNLVTSYHNTTSPATWKPLIFQGTPSPVIGSFNPTVIGRNQNPPSFGSEDIIAFGGTTEIRFTNGVAQVDGSGYNGRMTIYKTGVFVITAEDSSTGLVEAKASGALTVTVNNSPIQTLELDLASPQTNGTAFSGGTNRVRYVDTYGNPVATRPVAITTSLAGTIAIGGSTNNDHLLDEADDFDSSGIANFNNSSPTFLSFTYTGLPGSGVFTATAPNPLGGSLVDTAIVNIVPGPPVSARVLGRVGAGPFINNHTITAGQPISLEVRLFDASGNLATNYNNTTVLTFTLAPQPGGGITPTVSASPSGNVNLDIPRTVNIQFAGGVSTVTAGNNGLLSLYTEGGYELRVSSAGGITTQAGHHLAVTVNRGPFAKLAWAVVGNQVSGAVFSSATLTAQDAYQNTITNFTSLGHSVELTQTSNSTGTVTLTGGGRTLAPADFVAGVANLTARGLTYSGLAGSIHFKATATTPAVVGETDVTIVPGTPASARIRGQVGVGSLLHTQTISAGQPISLEIRLFDASGNLATNYNNTSVLTFTLAPQPGGGNTPTVSGSPSGNVDLDIPRPVSIQFVGGVSTVSAGNNGLLSLYTPGGYELRVSSAGGITTQTSRHLAVTVNPGPLAELLWNVPGSQASGVAFTSGTLTARDAYANTITNFASLGHSVELTQTSNSTGTVELTGGGRTLVPSDFVAGVADLADKELTYTGTAGLIHFKATAATPGVVGETDVTIVPGTPVLAHILGYTATGTLESNLTVVVHHPISLSIRLFDAAHNLANNFVGALSLEFNLTTNPTATITDSAGTAHALGAPISIGFVNGVSSVTNGVNGLMTIENEGTFDLTLTKNVPDPITTESGHHLAITVVADLGPVSIGEPGGDELLNLATVGDTVWLDANKNGIQESDEAGVEGVRANLFTADGVSVMADTTDAYGKYLFSGLKAASYYIEFVAPSGYAFTKAGDGSQTSVDSNVSVPVIQVEVMAGEQAWNYTARVPWVGSGTVTSGNDEIAGDGWDEQVAYTISYTNTDPTRDATDVVLVTTIPVGTSFVAAASSPGWRCTDQAAGGRCSLTLREVPANSQASTSFVLLREHKSVAVSVPPALSVSVIQNTAARSEIFTLATAETNLGVDAGLVPIAPALLDSKPTGPSEDTQDQGRAIFLPTVRSQE